MRKQIVDLRVTCAEHLGRGYVLLKLTGDEVLPVMFPGQFAELRADGCAHTFLRRPISINFYDEVCNEVWFLIHAVGEGTRAFCSLKVGDRLNAVLPLGNGFTFPTRKNLSVLLVGGGVGSAPLLYFGRKLSEIGCRPAFVLGGRSRDDLLQLDFFEKFGELYVTTEDGSLGEKGYVTGHSVLGKKRFDYVATCGPKPMMMAVARYARGVGAVCEVSLENLMACGLGACLCCVEETTDGNVCVCKEGPVFNIDRLLWRI